MAYANYSKSFLAILSVLLLFGIVWSASAADFSKDDFPDNLQGLALDSVDDLTKAVSQRELEEYGVKKWYGAYYVNPETEEKKISVTIACFDNQTYLPKFQQKFIAITQSLGTEDCDAQWSQIINAQVDGLKAQYLEKTSSPYYLDYCFKHEIYLFLPVEDCFIAAVIGRDSQKPDLSEAKEAAKAFLTALGLSESNGSGLNNGKAADSGSSANDVLSGQANKNNNGFVLKWLLIGSAALGGVVALIAAIKKLSAKK